MKAVSQEMGNCNGNFEAVVNRKQQNRHSDLSHMPEFTQQLQKVLEELVKRVWALTEEIRVEWPPPSWQWRTCVALPANSTKPSSSWTRQRTTSVKPRSCSTSSKTQLSPTQSGSSHMRKTSARTNSITCRTIDGLSTHSLQGSLHHADEVPHTIMDFGRVSSKDNVMLPNSFEKGFRLNFDEYVELLVTVVKPWMEIVERGKLYILH